MHLPKQLSETQRAKLLEICRADPRVFIENFLKIQTKAAGLIPFKLNTPQKIVYRIIQDLRAKKKPVRLVILKARQMGISTLIEGLLFSQAALRENNNCLITSHDKGSAERIFRMSEIFLDNLPEQIAPMVRHRTKSLIRFENPDDSRRVDNPGLRSQIQIATAKNVDVGASFTIHGGHLSELARWPFPEAALLSIMNAVPDHPDTLVAIESTPMGMGGAFYEIWQRAVQESSEWTPVFLPYWVHDEYQTLVQGADREKLIAGLAEEERRLMKEFAPAMTLERLHWRRRTIDQKCGGSVSKFQQEYPVDAMSCFIASGHSVFDPEAIIYHKKFARKGRRGRLVRNAVTKVVTFVADESGPLEVWKPPQRNGTADYVIGADSGMGMVKRRGGGHGDYSAAVVLSNHMEQVAQIRAHLDPHDFADYLDMLGRWYNYALIYPEVDGYGGGYAVAYSLNETYPRIGVTEVWDSKSRRRTEVMGFEPTGKSVPILISKLVREVHRSAGITLLSVDIEEDDAQEGSYKFSAAHRERQRRGHKLKVYSDDLCSEMTTYIINEQGKVGAISKGNDDLVRALGLAILGLEQIPPPDVRDPLLKSLEKNAPIDYDRRGISCEVSAGGAYPGWLVGG